MNPLTGNYCALYADTLSKKGDREKRKDIKNECSYEGLYLILSEGKLWSRADKREKCECWNMHFKEQV
ncbi:hypothetical protein K4L44_09785 [Halosquirtibacter laminarini]|uniref:Uncharacterized protein n=1 Tax=Halosquirtibacter laminarini TaxID=3374600 RepID=A0AC61NBP8_9BACT|nr:hypothetical protein K4L44_09785 [Prolixibacteraceae bacterium]